MMAKTKRKLSNTDLKNCPAQTTEVNMNEERESVQTKGNTQNENYATGSVNCESYDDPVETRDGKRKTRRLISPSPPSTHKRAKMLMEDHARSDGFDKRFVPEEIVDASDETGELAFLVKWAETKELEWVSARQANVKCPQIVISFYESRLKFKRATAELEKRGSE